MLTMRPQVTNLKPTQLLTVDNGDSKQETHELSAAICFRLHDAACTFQLQPRSTSNQRCVNNINASACRSCPG